MATDRIGTQKKSIWKRIKRLALTDVSALLRQLNASDLEAIERTLIEADFGVPATVELTEALEDGVRAGRLKTEADLRESLRTRLAEMVRGPEHPERLARPASGPSVVLVVGVNGVGKTTTAAKLAAREKRAGRSVLLAAADTWRAGAIAQLQTWAERIGVECVAGAPGGDPAAVAFDAIEAGLSRGVDVVLIDTAGRLHTQEGLMEELRKVHRVVARKVEGAPHETLLVVDGTVGQNAIQQGRLFRDAVMPTGIVVTKLDGSARGGGVVALCRELGLPIRFVGLGEAVEDLQPFDPDAFAGNLIGED